MPDPEKTSNQPIANLPVTVIGVRTEGTGTPITDGQLVVTPDHQPNLVFQVISPLVAISVRVANAFVIQYVGLLSAAGLGNMIIQFMDFKDLAWKCAVLCLPGAFYTALKSVGTILADLEKKHPLLTGSV